MTKIKVKYNVSEPKGNIMSFQFTDKQRKWLKETAAAKNITMSTIISRLVDEEMENGEDS